MTLHEAPPHSLEMTLLMTPDKANFGGKVHGGQMLKTLDEVAFVCASRYSGHYAVTLSVDQVWFKEPIHIGELVTFLASVNDTGRTSMEIGIKVISESLRDQSKRHVMTCYFTMVAVGEDGRPTNVPPRVPGDTIGQQRQRAARLRRELRREIADRYQAIRRSGIDTTG